MSVAAMTMDDQRPLLNTYDKMSKQYEQNLHVGSHAGHSSGAPPSGPASPTPSSSEEPPTSQHSYHHPHHHHHHHSHSHLHHQQQYQHPHHHNHHETTLAEQQQQQHQQQKHQLHEQPLQIEPQQQQVQQESSVVVVAEAVAAAEQRQRLLEDEIESLKLEQTRLAQQCADAQRREKILMRRLANKEQEFQDYVTQIAEYKAAQAPSAVALRSALLDPAVNLLFEKLKKELKATKAKLEETQNELSAWKFTPDSNTGKRLMAKCRLLYQENEELGKMTSNGRLAKLETELAMQKSFSEEVKKSQSELDDFLQELDEDVEGMQSTILFLQQELKTKRERIQVLEKENYQLRNNELKENETDVAAVTANSSDANANGNVNNTDANTSPLHCNNIVSNKDVGNNVAPYQLPAVPLNAANEYKYQLHKQQAVGGLETIDENECLRTHGEYYNGIGEEQSAPANMAMTVPIANPIGGAMDDCGSSNSSNNSTPQLRTLAARKRNFEETCSVASGSPTECILPVAATALPTNTMPQTAMQQQQVSSPRTLPPKKSKLRITTSRSNEHLNELGLSDGGGSGSNNLYNSPTHTAAGATTPIIDNAVAGMANEELTNNMIVESAAAPPPVTAAPVAAAEVIPQRIMTRRRSVRMQQNGNGEVNH